MMFCHKIATALFFTVGSILLLVAREGYVSATSINGRYDINDLLTCFLPGQNHEPVPEERLRVPVQAGPTGTVWLPIESAYSHTLPNSLGSIDDEKLANFLDSVPDFGFADAALVSIVEPVGESPPSAADLVLVEGSGGRLDMTFMEGTAAPIALLERLEQDERQTIESFISTAGLGRCVLEPVWTKLPRSYFPQYYGGTRCTNDQMTTSCSFPDGLQCEPDISTPDRMAFITVLRWDCCYSWEEDRWSRLECGWRHVSIPIVVDCICACSPKIT